jgi:hypothetical protein
MAAQGGVHAGVQHAQRGGVEPQEVRRQFGDSGARAFGVGRQVGRSQGTDLAVAGDTGVGMDGDYGGVKNFDGVSAGPFVAAFVQGQVHLKSFDPGDLGHRPILSRCRWQAKAR